MPRDRSAFLPIDFKTRFPALDGIRALAVTMVFLEHFGGGSHGGRLLQIFNLVRERMSIGVDIFFVLSGFLITGILFDTTRDSHYFKRFFARRSVRIFPVFYLLGLILLILTPIVGYHWKWRQLSFLVYMGNFFGNIDFSVYELPSLAHPHASAELSHLWSLCVEEQFYLIWPFVIFLVRDRVKLLWTCFGIAGLVLCVRIWVVITWSPGMAELWLVRTLPFRMDDLVMGAALALLLRGPAADRVQRSCKWLFLVGFAALLAIMVLSPAYTSPWLLSVGLSCTGIAAAGMIGMTLREGSPAYRLFHVRPARVLGRYSYGFYVWHLVWMAGWIQLLIWLNHHLHSIVLGGLVYMPLAFVTNFLIAKLSYDLFEVRFLKIKRHFEYDSELRTHKTAFAPDGN
jgi:peptidoglycan/LPS O-acetylase OafA/YrhL